MKQQLEITQVLISELKSPDYNPRFHPEKTIDQVAGSLKRNGFVQPVLLNCAHSRKNYIMAGNLRVKAAKRLGIKKIPAIYIEVPNLDDEKRLNLTLNRLSGEWDYDLLKDFPIETLLESGFDDIDLTHIWDENLSVEDDDFNVDDELKRIKTPITKSGDFFKLGSHYLICSDSTDLDCVKKLCNGEKIGLIYCDPPFNISLNYDKGIGTKGKYGGKTNDNKSDEEYRDCL